MCSVPTISPNPRLQWCACFVQPVLCYPPSSVSRVGHLRSTLKPWQRKLRRHRNSFDVAWSDGSIRNLQARFSSIFVLRQAKSSNSCVEIKEGLRRPPYISNTHFAGMTASLRRQASKLLRNADEEAAARPELRREHADAGAIPDLVDLVEQVHDVEPHGRRLVRRDDVEIVRQPDIDLGIGRHMIGIREGGAKPASVDPRGAEPGAVAEIGCAG